MRHSAAWYDQQYNARAGIPEHLDIMRNWKESSQLTRSRARCELDLAYSERGKQDASERLDVFLPERVPAAGAPVLLHIHGGYWRALHKEDQSFLAEPFTAAGAVVVVPNYALCPQVTVAHIVMQMVQAVAWTWRNIGHYGGDRQRLVVMGHSAGGHLAAMMLACEWQRFASDLPPDLLLTAIPVSGLFELEPLRHAPFLAPDIGLSAAEATRLSPAHMPAPAGKRLLPFVGELESAEFHRQSAAIHARWGDDVVAKPEAVAGCHHMNVLYPLLDPASRFSRAVMAELGL